MKKGGELGKSMVKRRKGRWGDGVRSRGDSIEEEGRKGRLRRR